MDDETAEYMVRLQENLLASSGDEGRAWAQLLRNERIARGIVGGRPAMYLQAAPLADCAPWDVSFFKTADALNGQPGFYFSVAARNGCRNTSEGVQCTGDNNRWILDIHKNGYISVLRFNIKESLEIAEDHFGAITSFGMACDRITQVHNAGETPYILRLKYFNSRGLAYGNGPLEIPELELLPELRDKSEDFARTSIRLSDDFRRVVSLA